MSTRKEAEYDLEVNHKSDMFHDRYILSKWNDSHTKFYIILKTNSKERLYMELDLLGIRDKMKFNKFCRDGGNKDGHIIFSMFEF